MKRDSTKPRRRPRTRTGTTTKRRAAEDSRRDSHQEIAWDLRLYVAGQTPKCMAALVNLKRLCEEHVAGRYRIEVIDLLENPQLARGDQILAIPTLVRKLPTPIRKIIGDLSNAERTLVGLQLRPHKG